MAEAKFTPGPWSLDGDRVVRCGDLTIADVLDTVEGLEGDCPEALHNGHLLAASPELYAACEIHDALYEAQENYTADTLAKFEAVIRKHGFVGNGAIAQSEFVDRVNKAALAKARGE
jgi:hypothetical protein